MANPLWFVIWLIILIIVAFPVAFFCAGWYVVLYPLNVCFPAFSGLTDFLLQGTQFTHYASKAMMECRSIFG